MLGLESQFEKQSVELRSSIEDSFLVGSSIFCLGYKTDVLHSANVPTVRVVKASQNLRHVCLSILPYLQ